MNRELKVKHSYLYLTRYMIGHYARMGKRWLLKAKG